MRFLGWLIRPDAQIPMGVADLASHCVAKLTRQRAPRY